MISREKRHYIIKANRLFGTENLDLGIAAELAQQCNELEDYKKAADRQLDSTVAECDRLREELGRVTKARNEWADKCSAANTERDRLLRENEALKKDAHTVAIALVGDEVTARAKKAEHGIARLDAAVKERDAANSQEKLGEICIKLGICGNDNDIADAIKILLGNIAFEIYNDAIAERGKLKAELQKAQHKLELVRNTKIHAIEAMQSMCKQRDAINAKLDAEMATSAALREEVERLSRGYQLTPIPKRKASK